MNKINPYSYSKTIQGYRSGILSNVKNDSKIDSFSKSSNAPKVLTSSDLNRDDIELIKKELDRKIAELKKDLSDRQNTRGFLTNIGNEIASLFGGGEQEDK